MQEAAARGEAAALRAEVTDLSRLVDAGAGLGAGEEAAHDELLRQRDTLLAERDTQAGPSSHGLLYRLSGCQDHAIGQHEALIIHHPSLSPTSSCNCVRKTCEKVSGVDLLTCKACEKVSGMDLLKLPDVTLRCACCDARW